jgi:hypothetical protein
VLGIGLQRDLPALPGAGLDAHVLQHDGQKPAGDLFAGRDHGVIFARIMHRRRLAAQADQLVGLARHRRNHDGHLVTGVDFAFHMTRRIADTLKIGDGCSAELQNQSGHGTRMTSERERGRIGGNTARIGA